MASQKKDPQTGVRPLTEVVRKGGVGEKPPAGKPPTNLGPGTTKPGSKPASK